MKSYLPEFPSLSREPRNGRTPYEGYQRGWGIEFGDLRARIEADPLYQEALAVSQGRSLLYADKRYNLFLLLRFFLPRIAFGNVIEFGVHRAGNAIFMAYVLNKLSPGTRVLALDTFAGMPETDSQIDAHNRGDFADVDLDQIREYVANLGLTNILFYEGLFEDTTKQALLDAGAISLAHIDCDIRSACIYSYEAVMPTMVSGGYVVFDDATVSSCIGATEVVEEYAIRRDGLSSEQIYPHFVFRAPGIG